MERFWYTAMQTFSQLPTVLVLLTGLVLAGTARRRLPRRSRGLMYAGLGVLLVDAGLGIGLSIVLPRMVADGWVRESGVSIMQVVMAVGLLGVLLHPVGLGLVIAAALTARRTPEPVPAAAWGEWTPPPAGSPAAAAQTGPAIAAPGSASTGHSTAGWGGADFPPLPAPPHPDAAPAAQAGAEAGTPTPTGPDPVGRS